MPRTLKLELTDEGERELLLIRDRAEKPYLRERVAALLKIADGAHGVDVADSGLLRPRARQTISEWVARYREQGVAGLEIRTGRGRKPAFSPEHNPEQKAREELLHLVGRAPEQAGQAGSRWKLETIRAACPWLEPLTLSGVWRVLDRLALGLKRGRDYVYSPDANYLPRRFIGNPKRCTKFSRCLRPSPLQ